MRVALVKQLYDVFGPWRSVKWDDARPGRLFDCWPGKPVYWEMTCLLQADWYVIPQQVTTAYIFDAVLSVPGRRQMIEAYSDALRELPIEAYDVVITLDPVLRRESRTGALFAYYAQEHWDPLYRRSLRKPAAPYDLFLDHMLTAPAVLGRLPAAVGFPYLRSREVARAEFGTDDKLDMLWLEARAVMALAMSDAWNEQCAAAMQRLSTIVGLPVVSKKHGVREAPYAVSDPPVWGDGRDYLRELGRCRYFASFGRLAGAGQALCDAASLGCICVGERGRAYHELVCHPGALCDDMFDVPAVLKRLVESESLRSEVQEWQDAALDEYFDRRPRALLAEAIAMKRAHG
jgi:hypothetical protein